MPFSLPSPANCLLSLPVELLLIIVGFSNEQNRRRNLKTPTPSVFAFSLVCRHLRRLCLASLFYRIRIAHTDQLKGLKDKCLNDAQFGSLIREVDLTHAYSPDEQDSLRRIIMSGSGAEIYRYGPALLPALLPLLACLERLELPAVQINGDLLAAFHSHSTLRTVAIDDPHFDILTKLLTTSSASMSKIFVCSAISETSFGLQTTRFDSLMSRGFHLSRLIVQDQCTIDGPGPLVIPGLESLQIEVQEEPFTWLQSFVERHVHLHVVKFSGRHSTWIQNPDILFSSQFVGELETEFLHLDVDLIAFSIRRDGLAVSFNQWPVVDLHLDLRTAEAFSALKTATSLAPQLSLMIIHTSSLNRVPFQLEDLISYCSLFPSLQRLELYYVHKHLLHEEAPPWLVPLASDQHRSISKCVIALFTLRWLAARLAQRSASLDFIHFTDYGMDFSPGYGHYDWDIQVTYEAGPRRELAIRATSKIVMANAFKPSDDIAALLSMTPENTRYYT
ncbi:hypothetical protein R3P38DRAFT_2924100 [Favolaschia claudopus]|uniref:F-box domain-containing protein n=1 Tax=Favolaschia claudopus TaxID=2862362 RepID=A0AAW0BVT4_9AGAR